MPTARVRGGDPPAHGTHRGDPQTQETENHLEMGSHETRLVEESLFPQSLKE